MKHILLLPLLCLAFIFGASGQTKPADILGIWLSEDKDGKIQIYQQGDRYFGKVVWGKDGTLKDDHNPDPKLRNRGRIGLVILQDFVYDDGVWEDGTIYDPTNGKTYSCSMKLKDRTHLSIRGYIGISLLGRSTVWTRVD